MSPFIYSAFARCDPKRRGFVVERRVPSLENYQETHNKTNGQDRSLPFPNCSKTTVSFYHEVVFVDSSPELKQIELLGNSWCPTCTPGMVLQSILQLLLIGVWYGSMVHPVCQHTIETPPRDAQ